jgi:putative membrane protein
MLYIARLLVYDTAAKVGFELSRTLKIVERRVPNRIVAPAVLLGWAIVLTHAYRERCLLSAWLDVKLSCVVGLTPAYGCLIGATRVRRGTQPPLA